MNSQERRLFKLISSRNPLWVDNSIVIHEPDSYIFELWVNKKSSIFSKHTLRIALMYKVPKEELNDWQGIVVGLRKQFKEAKIFFRANLIELSHEYYFRLPEITIIENHMKSLISVANDLKFEKCELEECLRIGQELDRIYEES